MANPLYSIITVCLNNKEGILQTASSIQEQTAKNFEWIVIDGQSSDGSADAIRSIPCLTHLISEPDDGIFHAMNKGISLAKGKYCLFLNSGDWLYSSTVLEEAANQLHGDLITGWLTFIYPDQYNKTPKLRRLDLLDIRKKYLYYRSLHHQATFIRRTLFSQFGGYDQRYNIYGDWDFFLRVINQGTKVNFIPLCIANYTFDGISSISFGTELSKKEIKKIHQQHFSPLYRIKRTIVDSIERAFNIKRGF